jgi:hypothetical protein
MTAVVGGDYMGGAGRQWQYRAEPTGLLRQYAHSA